MVSSIQTPVSSEKTRGAHRKGGEHRVRRFIGRYVLPPVLAGAVGAAAPLIVHKYENHGSVVPVREQALSSARKIVSIISKAEGNNAAQPVYADNHMRVQIGLRLSENGPGFADLSLHSTHRLPTDVNQLKKVINDIDEIGVAGRTSGGKLYQEELVKRGDNWAITGAETNEQIAAAEQVIAAIQNAADRGANLSNPPMPTPRTTPSHLNVM